MTHTHTPSLLTRAARTAAAGCAALLIALGTGCKGSTADGTVATDSVNYRQEDKLSTVDIHLDLARSGNALLDRAVAEYASETLGGTYAGDLSQGDSLAAYYGKAEKDTLDKYRHEYEAAPDDPPYAYDCHIRKTAEGKHWVTYTTETYLNLGGAHGMPATMGCSFRKSDGRRVTRAMLRDTDGDAFRHLLKEGVRSYFGQKMTDTELADCLMGVESVDYMPLPVAEPTLEKDGMRFTYQPYEIAAYAAGTPTFVITYDRLRPFLTQTLVEILKN